MTAPQRPPMTVAAVLQAARDVAPDATVTAHNTQAAAGLPDVDGRQRAARVVVTRRTRVDLVVVTVAFPGDLSVAVGLVRPGTPEARWLAVTSDATRRLGTAELRSTADLARTLALARELAGLPDPDRTHQAKED